MQRICNSLRVSQTAESRYTLFLIILKYLNNLRLFAYRCNKKSAGDLRSVSFMKKLTGRLYHLIGQILSSTFILIF
jgi:hypothetical protein